MRQRRLLAAISAAVVVPVLAGGLYRAAASAKYWAPPPTVRIQPDAARLAPTVDAATLLPLVLKRLDGLNRKPLRGRLDIFGKDRMRAWNWTYAGRAAVHLYHVTHDDRLIAKLLEVAWKYEALTLERAGKAGSGWFTIDTRSGTNYREVPVAGLIAAPVIDLLLDARTDPVLMDRLAPHRERLLAMVRTGIAGLSQAYVEVEGRGYYLLPSRRDVEPLNLMSVYARPLLGYWQLTGDAAALKEATGIARTWKSVLKTPADGSVSWPHTTRPETIPGPVSPPDLLLKASAGMEFPLAAYAAGIEFTRSDVEAIARAPMSTLVTPVDGTSVRVREFVDATVDRYIGYEASDPGPALRPAAWYAALCYRPEVGPFLDSYLFGVDPTFYRSNDVALLGVAQRLRLAQACGPQQQAFNSGPPQAW